MDWLVQLFVTANFVSHNFYSTFYRFCKNIELNFTFISLQLLNNSNFESNYPKTLKAICLINWLSPMG